MAGFFPPDGATAVPVLPTVAAAGTQGYFTSGSLTTQATIVSQDFLNGIVVELQNLAVVGGIPLSKSTCTVVPNILSLIQSQLGGFVRKVGDVMTGNLTLGTNYGTTSNTPSLIVQSGATSLNVVMNAGAGAYNTAVQLNDTVLYYTDGTADTSALTIGPMGTGGGLRLDNLGAATFTRAVTMNSTLSLLGVATGLTRPLNDNTRNLATTQFVLSQAATSVPLMDSTAATGISLQYARQDHVHPSDATRVRQGGGIGQTASNTNILSLGWSASGPKLTVDTTDIGPFGMLKGPYGDNATLQTWTGPNTFRHGIVIDGINAPADSGQLRLNNGSSGFSIYNNAVTTYFFLESDVNQSYNALRPMWIDNATGQVSFGGNNQPTWFAGPIQGQSVIYGSGLIQANTWPDGSAGYMRCALGASGSGDDKRVPNLGDFFVSHAGNGYQKLPSGVIIQWGDNATVTGNMDPIYLPIAFPNYFALVIAGEGHVDGWAQGNNGLGNVTLYGTRRSFTNAFYVKCAVFDNRVWSTGMRYGAGCDFNWIAIGW